MSNTWPNASRADQSEVKMTFKGQNLPLSSQGICASTLYIKPLINLGLPGLEARSMHVCGGTMFHFTGQVSLQRKLNRCASVLQYAAKVFQFLCTSIQCKILPGFYNI